MKDGPDLVVAAVDRARNVRSRGLYARAYSSFSTCSRRRGRAGAPAREIMGEIRGQKQAMPQSGIKSKRRGGQCGRRTAAEGGVGALFRRIPKATGQGKIGRAPSS